MLNIQQHTTDFRKPGLAMILLRSILSQPNQAYENSLM